MDASLEPAGFVVIEHTADVGFEAWAPSAPAVLRESARALAHIAFAGPAAGTGSEEYPLTVDGADWPDLLVNFLNEIVYLFDAGRFVAADCLVDKASATALSARLVGETRDPARHPWKLIVKAATYHDLVMEARDGRWHARVILDV